MTFSQRPLHLHIVSMHTSPLAQPGSGDAGGMNVYIQRSLRSLLALFPQLTVEIFTLATETNPPGSSLLNSADGRRARLHFIDVGTLNLKKEDLPAYTEAFAEGVLSSMFQSPDVIHAHYWLSGLVALNYAPEVPLVMTMHTTAAAKNLKAGDGEKLEPQVRLEGEQKIVDSACTLVVNTELEAEQMRTLYGASASQIQVIAPGVDRSVFHPLESHKALNSGSANRAHLFFAGRPQPLKGPHIVVEAMALLPADLEVDFEISGESGSTYEQDVLARARELEVRVTLEPAVAPQVLAEKFRQADIVVCPSSSETFGLVALEAQSCGATVLASDVDGLRTAVLNGKTGLLVKERTPQAWALALEKLIRNPNYRQELGQAASARTARMTWDDTAAQLMKLYLTISNTTANNLN